MSQASRDSNRLRYIERSNKIMSLYEIINCLRGHKCSQGNIQIVTRGICQARKKSETGEMYFIMRRTSKAEHKQTE